MNEIDKLKHDIETLEKINKMQRETIQRHKETINHYEELYSTYEDISKELLRKETAIIDKELELNKIKTNIEDLKQELELMKKNKPDDKVEIKEVVKEIEVKPKTRIEKIREEINKKNNKNVLT